MNHLRLHVLMYSPERKKAERERCRQNTQTARAQTSSSSRSSHPRARGGPPGPRESKTPVSVPPGSRVRGPKVEDLVEGEATFAFRRALVSSSRTLLHEPSATLGGVPELHPGYPLFRSKPIQKLRHPRSLSLSLFAGQILGPARENGTQQHWQVLQQLRGEWDNAFVGEEVPTDSKSGYC